MPKSKVHKLCCCLLLLLTTATCYDNDDVGQRTLKGVYSWKSLEFQFGSDVERDLAISSGRYKPGAAILIDVNVYYGMHFFFMFLSLFKFFFFFVPTENRLKRIIDFDFKTSMCINSFA